MAISTYDELQSAITNWLEADGIDANRIKEMIRLAEVDIQRFNMRELETTLSDTIASGVIPVPSDYRRLKQAYINTNNYHYPLVRQSEEFVLSAYPLRSSETRPAYIARQGSNFIFAPYPDSNYAVEGVYYKTLELTTSATTNDVLTNHPDLYLYGALIHSAPYLGEDARLPMWRDFFARAKEEIEDELQEELMSGSTPEMQPLG